MANRVFQVRERLQVYDADAVLISSMANIRWVCGFTGTNGLLFVDTEEAVLVTDGRYTEQARDEVEGADVVISSDGLMSRLVDRGHFDGGDRVVFQADQVTVKKYQKLRERISEVEWVPETGVLTPLVGSKDDSEIRKIRQSQKITEEVFEHLLDVLEPGLTERAVAAEITYEHLMRGADEMSFDPIVASGPNGARPHARPSDRRLQRGDVVVIDMGGVRDGYASDMTRTVSIGEPSEEARTVYRVVREAQQKAIEEARAGMKGKELDAVARTVIEEAGYGDAFSHGLGHGIGLEVHEWPRVSYTVDEELPVGACVTIEPGVYVPEKGFGVRTEDIVVLRSDGCDNLTKAPKQFHIL